MKINFLFFLLALPYFINAQNQNLRKAILRSDFIISFNHYKMDTLWINDFTSKVYINLDPIDEDNSWIYKNNLRSSPKKLSLRKMVDGEDFYSDLITNGGGCIMPGEVEEYGKTYHDLFFIIKEKNEYKIMVHFQSLEWEQLQKYGHQIESLTTIEKIKNEKERYAKTLDWFIENGLMPDQDFIDYYRQKGMIAEEITYTEAQYAKALQIFQNGKEELLPMVYEKYFEDIKQYYIQQLEDILKIESHEYNDYYNFDKAFRGIVGEEMQYDSPDYILYNSLTSDKFDKYDKDKFMQYLIEVAKNWKLNKE